MEDLRYPIGRWRPETSLDPAARPERIAAVSSLPAALSAAVAGLDDSQLDTPYRPEGWSVRQLVHHVADSHVNAYVRFRLALTEDEPPVKTYEEARWAELPDARTLPPAVSLALLAALHERWVTLLRALPAESFARIARHPDFGPLSVDQLLSLYAWHGRHHTAHVTALRARETW